MIFALATKQNIWRWSSTSPVHARRKEINGMAHSQTQALRLYDVMQAVHEEAANEQETLATIVHLLSSGQVRLSAHAMQAIRELLVTTTAAA
jgi:hypothetical protein